MPSVSGENALRSCEGLRFLVCADDSDEMLPRFLGMVNDGMCGGEAMLASRLWPSWVVVLELEAIDYGSRDRRRR